jgi:hypothetical protein
MFRPEAAVVGQNNSKVNFGILYEKEWGPQLPAHSRDTHDGFCRTIEHFPSINDVLYVTYNKDHIHYYTLLIECI